MHEHLQMAEKGFTLLHRDGTRTVNPPLDDVLRLLGELADGSGVVAVCHATGWRLRVHGDGVVEFGNDVRDDIVDRHLYGMAPAPLAELAEAIAVGSFYETLEHEWRQGPRPNATV